MAAVKLGGGELKEKAICMISNCILHAHTALAGLPAHLPGGPPLLLRRVLFLNLHWGPGGVEGLSYGNNGEGVELGIIFSCVVFNLADTRTPTPPPPSPSSTQRASPPRVASFIFPFWKRALFRVIPCDADEGQRTLGGNEWWARGPISRRRIKLALT